MGPDEMTATGHASLRQALERLGAIGYTLDFRSDGGQITAAGTTCRHPPEVWRVDETVRFEGSTDPDEQAILFAIRCPVHAVRGTYVAVYGPGTPPEDAEIVRRLGQAPASAAGSAAGSPSSGRGPSSATSPPDGGEQA